MERPSLKEWLKNNPGKGANDYFSAFPEAIHSGSGELPASPPFTAPIRYAKRSVEKKASNTIVVLAAFLPIVGFFLPWIKVRFLKIFEVLSTNGFRLPGLIESLFDGIPEHVVMSIYLIPISSMLVIIGEMIGVFWMKILGKTLTVILTIYWVYFIASLSVTVSSQIGINVNPFQLMDSGIYLTIVGVLVFFIDSVMDWVK